jgi:hypothetical protein
MTPRANIDAFKGPFGLTSGSKAAYSCVSGDMSSTATTVLQAKAKHCWHSRPLGEVEQVHRLVHHPEMRGPCEFGTPTCLQAPPQHQPPRASSVSTRLSLAYLEIDHAADDGEECPAYLHDRHNNHGWEHAQALVQTGDPEARREHKAHKRDVGVPVSQLRTCGGGGVCCGGKECRRRSGTPMPTIERLGAQCSPGLMCPGVRIA